MVKSCQLSDYTDEGTVVLTFYLFDFHPECIDALCSVHDAEWLTFTDDVTVLGVGIDQQFQFPLLSDSDGEVSEQYGVLHDEINGHKRVLKRAAFVVDSFLTVRYAWSSDDPKAKPDFSEVAAAAERTVSGK